VRVAQSMGTDAVDKLSPMFVGTIHSYCFQLLAGHVSEFGDYDVLDEHKMIGLLSREYNRYGLEAIADRRWEGIRIFNQHIDAIENELLPEDRLKETEIGKIYEAHTARLKQYHYLTYGQQISLAVRALEDPPVFEAVHEPLRYLFVDEYQDINPAQERLINLLGAEPVKVCVVGDDDQSIYQWRGSNVENILTFTRKYENAKSLPLVTNMRSRPQIVNAANEFVQSIGERLPKKMEFIRPGSDFELVSWMAETPQQEAEIIGDTILMLVKSGYRFQDIGLLFRSLKTSAGPFIETFTAYGIPFRIGGRRGLFLQSEAKVIGKILAWLNDKEWKQGQYSDFQNVTLDEILAELNQVFTIGRTNGDRARAILEKWLRRVITNQRISCVIFTGSLERLASTSGISKIQCLPPKWEPWQECPPSWLISKTSRVVHDCSIRRACPNSKRDRTGVPGITVGCTPSFSTMPWTNTRILKGTMNSN